MYDLRTTLLLVIAIFFLSPVVIAQDSLKIAKIQSKLKDATTDTAKALLYNELFVQYRDYDSLKAMTYANQSLKLSRAAGFSKGESLLLLNMGVFLNLNAENDEAVKMINQSLGIRRKTNDFAGQGYCLRALGNIEYDRNDYSKALELYLQAAPQFEKGNDLKGLSGDYIWIGNVFNEGLKQFDKAAEYFQKSLAIATRLNDSSLISYNYNNLGQSYYFSKKYDESLRYYQLSRSIKQALGDSRGLGSVYGNLSSVYFDRAIFDSALYYNELALVIRKDQNDKKGMATSYSNGANILLKLKQYPEALAQYMQAISLGQEIGFKEPVIESYNGLSQYYELMGDGKLALQYYKMFKAANDSVFNTDITQKISSLQAKYEASKKEQLITEQQFELTKKQYWIYGSLLAIVLISLLSFSYYRRAKLKQEKRLQEEVIKQQDYSTRAVIAAEENERKRIAADLHDGVGQIMSAAKMNLSVFEDELVFSSPEQKISFERVIGLVDESCREIRSVSHQMMPNALLKSGLASAIKEFIDKIDSNIIKVTLHAEGLNDPLDKNIETVLYRVVQECVNNVLKHSGANHLDISLIKDSDGLSATIEDNGNGFNSTDVNRYEGIGLKNMRSRISYLRGTIDFDSTAGRGTVVAIHVPVI